jgi:hypothetical protein
MTFRSTLNGFPPGRRSAAPEPTMSVNECIAAGLSEQRDIVLCVAAFS